MESHSIGRQERPLRDKLSWACSVCGKTGCTIVHEEDKNFSVFVTATLPLIAVKVNGGWIFEKTSDPTVHLFNETIQDENILWVGCPVITDEEGYIPNAFNNMDSEERAHLKALLLEQKCYPIFLDDTMLRDWMYYSSLVLYPALHNSDAEINHADKWKDWFDAYRMANASFRKVIFGVCDHRDRVMILGHQLMLLPEYLCDMPRLRIGWYSLALFPSFDGVDILPSLSEFLEGVLYASVIGFISVDCRKNFIKCCIQALDAEAVDNHTLSHRMRFTDVRVFAHGISSNFPRTLDPKHVGSYFKKLREEFSNKKVIVAVDCMRKSDGVMLQMLAFERFLEKFEDRRGSIVFVLVMRCEKSLSMAYLDRHRRCIRSVAKRINVSFGSDDYLPLVIKHEVLDIQKACSYYSIADLYLATPLKAGLSLSAFEFLACRGQLQGNQKKRELTYEQICYSFSSLFLSGDPRLINPLDIESFACALDSGLSGEGSFEFSGPLGCQEWIRKVYSLSL